MRGAIALLLLVGAGINACARNDGRWPSLKPRPAELQGLQTIREGDTSRKPPASPKPTIQPSAVASRVMLAEVEVAKARSGLSVERAAMTSALAAAQGVGRDNDAWAAAQLQLTRLEVIAGRLDDFQPTIAALARDAEASDPPTLARARALAANLQVDRATLSRVTQSARDALAR